MTDKAKVDEKETEPHKTTDCAIEKRLTYHDKEGK